jgi:hypothetical protein
MHFTFTIELRNNDDKAQHINLFHENILGLLRIIRIFRMPSCMAFDYLDIINNAVQENSKWHLEGLSYQINLFRELPDKNMFTFATAVSQFYIRFHIVISFAASSPS